MKTYIHVTNPQDEQATSIVHTMDDVKQTIAFVYPALCPYVRQVKMDIALKVKDKDNGDMFPKITRTFLYKKEEYNGLPIHTIAIPDINSKQHYVSTYKSFVTYQNAMDYLINQIETFLDMPEEKEEDTCDCDDLPY